MFDRLKKLYRTNRQCLKENVSGIPRPISKVILIGMVAMEALTLFLLLTLNLLPLRFLLLVIVILIAIDAGILALALNRKHGKKRAYSAMIAAMLLMILLLPASYYLYSTGDALQKISAMRDQWEDYHVIAVKDSEYEELADIKGKQIYAIKNSNKMNEEANERLVTAADAEIKEEADIMSLAHRIEDEKGGLHNNLIFTSQSYYDFQCEEIDDFKKNTKIVYTMQVKKKSNRNSKKVNVTEDPFNVYLTGIDAWGSIDKVSRSDVNMIITVNPQTKQILLTSMPRDSYVELHSFGQMDKLTHSGIYGVDETIDTVQDWMDIDLDYYVKINFSMVVKLINDVDGIYVYSDKAFKSAISDYEYTKGKNYLTGKGALYFARERKAFKGGDAERIKNQQKVMKALLVKVTNSRVILTKYPELLEDVAENMTTNMSDRDMRALARMQLRTMDEKWSIQTNHIKCTEASKGTYSMGMGRPLYVNIPDEKSVEDAKKKIHDVMYPAEAIEETEPLLP